MLLLLRCNSCGQHMNYESRDAIIIGKKKKCVYCGKTFTVNRNSISQILKS